MYDRTRVRNTFIYDVTVFLFMLQWYVTCRYTLCVCCSKVLL